MHTKVHKKLLGNAHGLYQSKNCYKKVKVSDELVGQLIFESIISWAQHMKDRPHSSSFATFNLHQFKTGSHLLLGKLSFQWLVCWGFELDSVGHSQWPQIH